MKFQEIVNKKDRILLNLTNKYKISIQELREILKEYSEGILFSWIIPKKFNLEEEIENWFIFSQTALKYILGNKLFSKFNLGREVEIKGCKYLSSLGFKIILLNYRSNNCEIDIICSDEERSVRFVEVKSSFNKTITPDEKINKEKINKILKASEDFINEVGYLKVQYDALFFNDNTFRYYQEYII